MSLFICSVLCGCAESVVDQVLPTNTTPVNGSSALKAGLSADHILISPDELVSGATLAATIINDTPDEAIVVGADAGCSCYSAKGLPVTVPPFGTAELSVVVESDSKREYLAPGMQLIVDHPDINRLPVMFHFE